MPGTRRSRRGASTISTGGLDVLDGGRGRSGGGTSTRARGDHSPIVQKCLENLDPPPRAAAPSPMQTPTREVEISRGDLEKSWSKCHTCVDPPPRDPCRRPTKQATHPLEIRAVGPRSRRPIDSGDEGGFCIAAMPAGPHFGRMRERRRTWSGLVGGVCMKEVRAVRNECSSARGRAVATWEVPRVCHEREKGSRQSP